MPAMPGVPDRGHIAGGPRKLPLMHRQRSQPELMLKLRVSVKHAARHNAIDCGCPAAVWMPTSVDALQVPR